MPWSLWRKIAVPQHHLLDIHSKVILVEKFHRVLSNISAMTCWNASVVMSLKSPVSVGVHKAFDVTPNKKLDGVGSGEFGHQAVDSP
jgi:hypothetical protein